MLAAPLTSGAAGTILRRDIGFVSYRVTDDAPVVPITGDQSLRDDTLLTGYASRGEIVFPDSSVVTVGPTTSVRIGAFKTAMSGAGSTVQLLGTGTLRFQVRHPQGARASYTFTGTTSQIAVRGTTALLSSDAAGDTVTCLDCTPGDVVVTVAKPAILC